MFVLSIVDLDQMQGAGQGGAGAACTWAVLVTRSSAHLVDEWLLRGHSLGPREAAPGDANAQLPRAVLCQSRRLFNVKVELGQAVPGGQVPTW